MGWPALATVATTAALLNPLTIVPPKHLRKHCNSVNTIQLAQAKKGFDKHVYDDLGGLGEATTTVAAVSADVIDADGANGDASATAGGAATPVSGALLTTAGLDNAYHYADCAYLNSLLQVLFAHNDIRALCMRAQRGSYHHRSIEYNTKGNPVLISTPSFLCEIGFIFHMMSQVIDFKCKSAAGDDNQAGEERRIVGHNDPAHRELNSDFDQLVVVPTRFQQIYAHSDQVATLGLLPSSHKAKEDTATAGKAVIASSSGELSSTTSAGQLVQPAFRFLLLQLNKEVEAEGKYYDSLIPPVVVPVLPIPIIGGPKQPPKAVSGAGAGATGPAYTRHQWSRPKENVIDAIFGLDIACENHYIKSDYSEVAPTTHALSLELVDPQTLLTPPVSALGVRQASVSNTGSHISIAQVLYKSLKKVQFLKGYCTHTQTYDAFQQTRTVKCSSFGAASSATAFSSTGVGGANAEKISHSLLTILCGQSMLCPNAKATNPLTGAVSVNGSPTLSYIDADGVLHLPAAIEMVSSVITTGGVAFEKLDYISCLLMVPMPAPVSLPSSTAGASAVSADTDTTASGEQKKHCWFIYDGKKEEVSTVPASVRYKLSANITTTLDANGSPTSSRTMIQTLDLCSVVSEIRSVTPDRATGVVNTQTHTILHQYLSGEWLLFNDYQIGRAAEESKSCVEEVLSCQTAYRKPAILLYTIRPESTAAATGTAGVGAEVSAAHPLEMIPFRSVSLASYAVPPAVLSAENLAQDTARPQYKGKHISYKIPPGCYRSTGPNAAVLYRDNDDGCPVPVIRDGDTEAAVVTGALSRSQTSELETGQAATGHQTLWEPFSLHPVSARYQQSEMDAGAYYYLAGANDLIAVDAEFVAIGSEKYEISSAGKRTVSEDSRQVLARVSLLYGGPYDESGVSSFDLLTSTKRSYKAIRTYVSLLSNEPNMNSVLDPVTGASSCSALYFQVLQDDYIIPSHTVTDYLTRFSGIIPEDLYPQTSSHNLTSSRIAYCKLRYFLDRGCIFVGHGLCKDFEIANIHVPSTQVIDTVNIFRLSHQRKISLKFLSYVLLQADIQVSF